MHAYETLSSLWLPRALVPASSDFQPPEPPALVSSERHSEPAGRYCGCMLLRLCMPGMTDGSHLCSVLLALLATYHDVPSRYVYTVPFQPQLNFFNVLIPCFLCLGVHRERMRNVSPGGSDDHPPIRIHSRGDTKQKRSVRNQLGVRKPVVSKRIACDSKQRPGNRHTCSGTIILAYLC